LPYALRNKSVQFSSSNLRCHRILFFAAYKLAFPSFDRFEGRQYRPAFSVLGPKMRVSPASCKVFRIFGSCCFSRCLLGRVAGCRFSPAPLCGPFVSTPLFVLCGRTFLFVTLWFVSTLDSSFRSSADTVHYECTARVSGTMYVTTNTLFHTECFAISIVWGMPRTVEPHDMGLLDLGGSRACNSHFCSPL